ncbi:imidazole glycerol phosphate synthase subunit HisH [Hydrogenovibrio marinus]|uniref:Imidazole glycerol phosphate synthase subunit HisH n=1 Tax=Hydrogenovibrio marinus TaxID=28885 RepID=A0A067A115_HYDMR|nr:imidazole glycerol phosphate synthase subunit HisH [Hydrogenovibrio marinus]KDN96301.1 imidazole glycerol phosphate synthase [Hydrogenovibrio marinus]BBN60515.1 imidazole glycerol phosphate synthase subunit HisH [Hydrogenovibrio marinus]
MTKHVVVVDYGMGNLRSVAKAAEHMANDQTKIVISSHPEDIDSADAIIFPGQGAAKACMQALNETGMIHSLQKAANEKPFLGICMGLQVLMTHSQENNGIDCLNILKGDVVQFDLTAYPELKMPHMGWNQIHQTQEHPLWHNIPQDSRFYFVHSYYVMPEAPEIIAGETTHGTKFTSAIAKDNLFAIQAHPEKSAESGLQLFKNFLNWQP